jgi:hypothetical protein
LLIVFICEFPIEAKRYPTNWTFFYPQW